MTAMMLMEKLSRLGVSLHAEGNQLRYRGPAAVITPELKQSILEQKAEIIARLNQTENYGPGRPSPENAARPVAERCKEARELCGELNHLYDTRAAILEGVAGFSRAEAERLAMSEVI